MVSDEELQSSELLEDIGTTRDRERFLLYNESYYSVVIWTYNPGCPVPLYIVCGMQLVNLAFGPVVVTITHSHLISKDVDYFKYLLEYRNSKAFV